MPVPLELILAVTSSINSKGTGITLTDNTGGLGNFTISGTAAAELNIAADLADGEGNTVEGTNLQKQYVSEASKLSDLNYGRGIATGSCSRIRPSPLSLIRALIATPRELISCIIS